MNSAEEQSLNMNSSAANKSHVKASSYDINKNKMSTMDLVQQDSRDMYAQGEDAYFQN